MSIGPEAGRRHGRVTGWVGALKGGLGLLSDPMGRNKVKPEQASKVRMRMPTLRSFGDGCTRGEVIDTRTHAIRRGSGFAVTGGDPSRTRVKARLLSFCLSLLLQPQNMCT